MSGAGDLALLPFAQQRALIAREARDGGGVAELLRGAGRLRDHEPLVWVLAELARHGRLEDGAARAALAEVLLALPDAGVHRLLGGAERLGLGGEMALIEAAVTAARAWPFERIAALCLVDRWLKNAAPGDHAELAEQAWQRAVRAASDGDHGALDALADTDLLRVPGARYSELGQRAAEAGSAEALRARLARFADRVIDTLSALPKSISQANAEELLARRVYTDAGHFLFELLQNAEDSGARRFSVHVESDAITVEHDGAPFDARDVVGVLSIGQTTKRKEQIGFFGVGFKSIYEVCERPRVYSGPFSFEIADVSIPRRLAPLAPPVELERDGATEVRTTRLVLPLRRGVDATHLFERARDIPAETLLTLRVLERIELRSGERAVTLELRGDRDDSEDGRIEPGQIEADQMELLETVELVERVDSDVARRRYAVTRGRLRDDSGARELGRASESELIVAAALGADGVPEPLPAGRARVFSFLPTGEQPRVGLLIHAHFDVPLDRERLDRGSRWNALLLERAGAMLGPALGALARRRTLDEARSEAVLALVPRAAELDGALWQRFARAAAGPLAHTPLLRGAAGDLLAPMAAAVAEDAALSELLAGHELALPAWAGASGQAPSRRVAAPLGGRDRRVAFELGAAHLDATAFAALLELGCAAQQPASWLRHPRLVACIGRAAPSLGVEARARLAALPLLPDEAGELARASELWRASAAVRVIYGESRRLLACALDHADDDDTERGVALFAPPRLTLETALEDIANDGAVRAAVAEPRRLGALLDAVAAAGAGEPYAALLDAAIFATDEGGVRALQRAHEPDPGGRRDAPDAGLLAGDAPTVGGPAAALQRDLAQLLRTTAGRRPALLSAQLERAHGATLQRLGAATFDLATLAASVDRGETQLRPEDRRRLHVLLDAHADGLTRALGRALAACPIFDDVRGVARPLVGPERALLPADAEIERRFDAPWLDAALRPASHVATRAQRVDIRTIIATLCDGPASRDASGAPLPLSPAADLEALYELLAARADELTRSDCEALGRAPIWRADSGTDRAGDPREYDELLPLGRLRRRAEDPRIERAYEVFDVAPVASEASLELARRLGVPLPPRPDAGALVARVAEAAVDDEQRDAVLDAINAAAETLADDELAPLVDVPLFRDTAGVPRAVGRWSDPPDAERVYRATPAVQPVLAAGSLPLLCDDDERAAGAVLDRLGAPPAEAAAMLAALGRDEALAGDTQAAASARAALLALAAKGTLDATAQALGDAVIWPREADGELAAARTLCLTDSLAALVGEVAATLLPERRVSAACSLDAEAAKSIVPFADPLDVIIDGLEGLARCGEPLEAQTPLLSSREALADLAARVRERDGDEALTELPLSLDADANLARGPRRRGAAEALLLSEGTALAATLADPRWAAALRARDEAAAAVLCPPVEPRHLLAELAQHGRSGAAAEAHPVLGDARRRAAFYRWLLLRSEAIERDGQARGVLGNAALIGSAAGTLRAPRELLFARGLAADELGDELRPEAALSSDAAAWLMRLYRLEEGRLARLLGHLLDALDLAVRARDVERVSRLCTIVARTLGGEALIGERVTALPTSVKLRRRLRVPSVDAGSADADNDKSAATRDGGDASASAVRFVRPRQLLLADDDEAALIAAFSASPPPRPLDALVRDADVAALLRALGAFEVLDAEALARALDTIDGGPNQHSTADHEEAPLEGRSSAGAAASLARYVARAASRRPALVEQLDLRRRRWLPDQTSTLHRPDELYSPLADVEAVLGPDAPRPHPVVAAELGEALERLGLRRLDDAALDDVAAHARRLEAGEQAAPAALLDWLERQLATRELRTQTVRSALRDIAVFPDADGTPRHAGALLRQPRPDLHDDWRAALQRVDRLPRLADALALPARFGPREAALLLGEIADVLAAQTEAAGPAQAAPRRLARWPELTTVLPRCLALACSSDAGGKALANIERLALLGTAADGRRGALLWPGEALALDEPAELVHALREAPDSSSGPWLCVLPAPAASAGDGSEGASVDSDQQSRALLLALGVPTLEACFSPKSIAFDEPNASERQRAEARRLATAIGALLELAPHLRAGLDAVPWDAWAFEAIDGSGVEVVLGSAITREGQLAERPGLTEGLALRCASDGAFDAGSGALVLTPRVALDELARADVVVRALLLGDVLEDERALDALVELVADLLAEDDIEAMRGVLREAGISAGERSEQARRGVAPPTRAALGITLPEDAPSARRSAAAAARSSRRKKASRSARADGETAGDGDKRAAAVPDHASEPAARGTPAPPPRGKRGKRTGWLTRVRRWWRDGDEPDTSDDARERERARKRKPKREPPRHGRDNRDALPSAAGSGGEAGRGDASAQRDHARWFEPEGGSSLQLGSTRDPDELARPPRFGFAFRPRRLPAPFLYAPKQVLGRFSRRAQRWEPTDLSSRWLRGGSVRGGTIAFEGELPAGDLVLPVPLYGRVDALELTSGGASPRRQGSDELGVRVRLRAAASVRLDVGLFAPPEPLEHTGVAEHDGHHDADQTKRRHALIASTVPDGELPEELLDQLADWRQRPLAPLERALAARDFVRERYRYDPSYLEDRDVGRWLQRVTQGRANRHVAALHAGADGHILGRGVCYELNALCCEMLRRLDIPAAIATGWVLDSGFISEPDHLWVLALLPTDDGPRFFPIDASTTRDGTDDGPRFFPIDASTTRDGRPLHATRSPGPWRPPRRRAAEAPTPPPWARRAARAAAEGRASAGAGADAEGAAESASALAPVASLTRVVRYLLSHGAASPVDASLEDDASLASACRALLADRERAAALLALLEHEDERGDLE